MNVGGMAELYHQPVEKVISEETVGNPWGIGIKYVRELTGQVGHISIDITDNDNGAVAPDCAVLIHVVRDKIMSYLVPQKCKDSEQSEGYNAADKWGGCQPYHLPTCLAIEERS